MRIHHTSSLVWFTSLLAIICNISCKKMLAIDPPKHTLTNSQIFKTPTQAEYAMAGIYTMMINGDSRLFIDQAAGKVWSAGLVTRLGGLSAGEFSNSEGVGSPELYSYSTSKLRITNSGLSDLLWNTAYQSIYGANSVIEGIAASTSPALGENVRKTLTAEAKFIRAFAYFNLTNFFGDVPLVLTIDFNKTAGMARTSEQLVYQQIIEDLKEAAENLPDTYPNNPASGEVIRVRPNKLTATALLARAYLYNGKHADAVAAASKVIEHRDLYELETDLNNTFLAKSREAIWQLRQTEQHDILQNATPEGFATLPAILYSGRSPFPLSDQLMNAFEPGDRRRAGWLDSAVNSNPGLPPLSYYATKYKIGNPNRSFGPASEYYMVLRLAELFLIRAEANANGGPGGLIAAIDDLNILRRRAGLPDLPDNLSSDQVLIAVNKERQTELFAEWAHRWFDLKRSGKASQVLQTISLKLPWEGDHQLLYPIPVKEIRDNRAILQNPGYF